VLSRGSDQDSSPDSDNRRSADRSIRARFEAVALPHLDAVYRLARALGSSEAEADDLVQETFVRAYQAFDTFELREYGAKPWLYRILHNTFYSLKGKQRRDPTLLDKLDFDHFASGRGGDSDSAALERLNWEQLDDEVKSAIERLRPEYRAALLLWSIDGLTYKDIAAVCDCAVGTVMSRLYRARRLLGRELLDYARERNWPTKRFE